MNAILIFVVESLFKRLWPAVPESVIILIINIVTWAASLVTQASEMDSTGEEKKLWVTTEITKFIDENLDTIPYWSKLSETQRDMILSGIIEVVVFFEKSGK
jgi:hypothetical protein